jgi:hypothetical protein
MAPAGFFVRELSSARLAIRKAQLDFGAKQQDAFSVDMAGKNPFYSPMHLQTSECWHARLHASLPQVPCCRDCS